MAQTKTARFKRHFLGFRPWTRHSLILLVAGLMYIAFGLSLIETRLTFSRKEGLQIALEWFPIEVWGMIWIGVGVTAILSAKWPPTWERWGYMALTGFTAGWSAIYLSGIIFGEAPVTNLSFVIVWAMVAFVWWGVSGLVDPPYKEAERG